MAVRHYGPRSCLFALLTLIPSVTSALILSTPTATIASGPRYLGAQVTLQTQPTHLNPAHELFARQQITLATCGYINGASSAPVTCNSGLYCATTSTFVGCCESANCRNIFTSCYDLLGDTCDQACQNNPQNLLCSSTVPYCAEYRYEGGSIGLGCAKISGYTSTVLLTIGTNLGALPTNTSATAVTVTATASSTVPTSTSGSGGGLSTGATAGIAVGATLVGVGLIGGLIWFLIKRKRKTKNDDKVLTTASPELATMNSKRESGQRTYRDSRYSELAAKSPSPTPTPEMQQFRYSGQPSPGFAGPPQYSQHYDGQIVEMPDNARPQSYAPTELSSNR